MFGLSLVQRISYGAMGTLRLFHLSPHRFAEPPKRKQRVDPGLIQHRTERKIKKIEKEIRQLERVTNKPKPVEELTLNFETTKQISKFRRKAVIVTEEEQERRALLYKEWSRYKLRQFKDEMRCINRMVRDQERALRELRMESEELYQAAIQPSNDLLPFMRRGPTETPPVTGYIAPDGDYSETTKTYDL